LSAQIEKGSLFYTFETGIHAPDDRTFGFSSVSIDGSSFVGNLSSMYTDFSIGSQIAPNENFACNTRMECNSNYRIQSKAWFQF